jgi:hypothetical protein
VLVAASTVDVLIPAVFGLIGTIVGALISRAVAVSQHRADKDADVRLTGAKYFVALDELVAENSAENIQSARARLTELGYAAISAGFDRRLALGAIRHGGENILLWANPANREGMRVDPMKLATECGHALVVAVDFIPYRRRRGPFMNPDLKKKADKYTEPYEALHRIPAPPEQTGPMWRVARLWDRLRGV